jgi:hypothetical protein
VLDFIKSELEFFSLKLTPKQNGREGVEFLIGENQIYLQPLDLDAVKKTKY